MINFNDKELKIINEFKNYIKDFYIDFINHEVIEVYSLQKRTFSWRNWNTWKEIFIMFLLGFLIGGLAGIFTICLVIMGDNKE